MCPFKFQESALIMLVSFKTGTLKLYSLSGKSNDKQCRVLSPGSAEAILVSMKPS